MNKIPVLKIRAENGNIIPINVIRGDRGKSAYEQAQEGGYKGTEEAFVALLNGLTEEDPAPTYEEASELENLSSGEKLSIALGKIKKAITELLEHLMNNTLHNRATKSGDITGGALGTNASAPYGGGAVGANASAVDAGGAVGANASAGGGGAVGCEANAFTGGAVGYKAATGSGGAVGFQAYADDGGAVGYKAKTGGGFAGGDSAQTVDNSENPINAIQLGSGRNSLSYTLQVYGYLMMDEKGKIPTGRLPFASGHYQGTNTYGTSNPNTLTFDFVPKFVIVCQRGERNATGGGCFIWIRGGSTLNFINNGSTYWVHPTLNDKTLSWYCSESASYQLNSSSYTYDYFAWG